MRIDGVAGPPEVELQSLLGKLPARAWWVARFESPRWVNKLVSVAESLHINNEIIDFRIDIGPSRDAPDAVIGLVVALGDRRFADVERSVKGDLRSARKLASLNGTDRGWNHAIEIFFVVLDGAEDEVREKPQLVCFVAKNLDFVGKVFELLVQLLWR